MVNNMTKIKKIFLTIIMILTLTSLLTACGDSGRDDIKFDEDGKIIVDGDAVEVKFWGWGDKEEVEVFTRIVNSFNKKYEGAIKVNYIQRPSGSYADNLLVQLSGKSGPDVFYAQDKVIKQYASMGYCEDLSSYVANSKYDTKLNEKDLFSNILNRYRYNVTTTTSNADDPLWAVPKDLAPTAIFYNKTHFKNAGISIISKTEAEMIAEGGSVKAFFKDNSGKYTESGMPGLVFNNKIPMNWEECIELSNYLQNEKKVSQYGFFSEWWFNYGWSVGGNCVEYVETSDAAYNEGRYKFTLNDSTKNYIVREDSEAVTINGTTYNPGETISYQDKIATNDVFGNSTPAIRQEVLDLVASGNLDELPSQREAFTEFVRLSQKTNVVVDTVKDANFYGADASGNLYGYGITPNPTTISADGKTGYFTSGKVSMLVNTFSSIKQVRENMKDEWDVAPVLQYKEYSSDGKSVLVRGKQAAHSGSVGICVNAKSDVKQAAYCFAEYIASAEGQRIQAEEGFAIPIQKSVASEDFFINSGLDPKNIQVFVDACEYETAGDWWLLRDAKWIDPWANLLNGDVRNGKITLSQFYQANVYLTTQERLDSFTKK
jgi:ABC-type glycerol-3-phosphate transport system substrate-binding protein